MMKLAQGGNGGVKLVYAIVQDEDAGKLVDALVKGRVPLHPLPEPRRIPARPQQHDPDGRGG